MFDSMTDNLIGKSPFLSKIQGFFSNPVQPIQPQQAPGSILPQVQMPQPKQEQGGQGGGMEGLLQQIMAMFGG